MGPEGGPPRQELGRSVVSKIFSIIDGYPDLLSIQKGAVKKRIAPVVLDVLDEHWEEKIKVLAEVIEYEGVDFDPGEVVESAIGEIKDLKEKLEQQDPSEIADAVLRGLLGIGLTQLTGEEQRRIQYEMDKMGLL